MDAGDCNPEDAVLGIEALLTPEDVAQHLRVSEETLTTWRSTGRQHIPFVKVGSLVRYRPRDIAAFIVNNLQAA